MTVRLPLRSARYAGRRTPFGSDGIDPPAQLVTLEVGAFSLTVPAGGFKADRKGRFEFDAKIGGTKLKVEIRSLGVRRFDLEAEGKDADIGDLRPVAVHLATGDDKGDTTVVRRRR